MHHRGARPGFVVLALALSGCGASTSHGGIPQGAQPTHGSQGGQHEISKEGLAAAELVTAVAGTAVEHALWKECVSVCISPSVCDRRTGLCTNESLSQPGVTPHLDGRGDGSASRSVDDTSRVRQPTGPEPTCGGLCLPGERCVVTNGQQDCVPLEKAPPR